MEYNILSDDVEVGSSFRPFFIVGHPRSGTTLLRFFLSSHPRLYVPAETGFLPFLDTDPRAELDRTAVAALLHRIGRLNRFWDGLVVDEEAFYTDLPRPTLPFILDALFRQKMPIKTARWGDKTPLYIQYIPQIQAIFPQAQFIHMIRDGRDAALSARTKWGRSKPYMDLYYLLRNWVSNVQAGRASGDLLGQNHYCEVHYEALAKDPEGTLQALCDFLGESYAPSMLDFQQVARRDGSSKNAHVDPQKPLHSGSIGRWRRELTPFERQLAYTIAGPLLTELGYVPDEDLEPLSTAGKLRLAWLSTKFQVSDSLRYWLYRRQLLTLNYNLRRWRRWFTPK